MSRIGVFDSGVGGLTVLASLRRELPECDYLYVGDTARVPYGRKPREMVEGFAREIAAFLVRHHVDAIVIACNTASAAALPQLAQEMDVPVWGVIEPGVRAAVRASRGGHVGVIGTMRTIESRSYQKGLEAAGMSVWARACPMLVHIAEEGLAESDECELLVRYYLRDMPKVDSLILGCTHYPLLAGVLQRVAGPDVRLVSSADAVAEAVREYAGPLRIATRVGTVEHLVTGDAQAFRHTAERIAGVDGPVHELTLAELAGRTA
jgi:glutamate racemase